MGCAAFHRRTTCRSVCAFLALALQSSASVAATDRLAFMSLGLVAHFGHLLQEQVLEYDLAQYDFRNMMQRIFQYDDLEHIHKQHEEFLRSGPVAFEADQSTPWHKTFYSSPLLDEFVELYQRFVKV